MMSKSHIKLFTKHLLQMYVYSVVSLTSLHPSSPTKNHCLEVTSSPDWLKWSVTSLPTLLKVTKY